MKGFVCFLAAALVSTTAICPSWECPQGTFGIIGTIDENQRILAILTALRHGQLERGT